MLVSSIARFNAARSMNNAAFGVMQSQAQVSNAVSNNTFGGENNLAILKEMDKKLSLDIASKKFLYKLANQHQILAKKHQEQNIKNSFSTFA